MDLQKVLDESGYSEAVEELAGFKRDRDQLAARILIATPAKAVGMQRDLDELNKRILVGEAALTNQYAKTLKLVDKNNDLEFTVEQCMEIAEQVAEEFDKFDPEAAKHVRAIMKGEESDYPRN